MIEERASRARSSRFSSWCLPGILALFVAAEAHAHNLGESYLYLQVYRDSVSGRFEIALSVAVVFEYEEVLLREAEVLSRTPGEIAAVRNHSAGWPACRRQRSVRWRCQSLGLSGGSGRAVTRWRSKRSST